MGANRKESKQINFRVSDEEYQRLQVMADNVGMTVPAFCKAKAQGARLKAPKVDRQGAMKIATELRRIGVNMNQIAKQANKGDKPLQSDLKAVQEELDDIWQLLKSGIQK